MYKALFAALIACAALPGQQNQKLEKKIPMTTVTGTFDVTMLPPSGPAPADGFARLSLDKKFQGPLEGASHVEMMATGDGTSPAGGYVALEKFTGKLDGKPGTFVMQHSGTMSPGSVEISVVVSPGSGTGDLAGITGKLEIRQEGKQHYYTLHYALAK